jgi:hypothetical protein
MMLILFLNFIYQIIRFYLTKLIILFILYLIMKEVLYNVDFYKINKLIQRNFIYIRIILPFYLGSVK